MTRGRPSPIRTTTIRLSVTLALVAVTAAQGQIPSVATCAGGTLSQTASEIGADLEVTTPCQVPAGTWQFRDVNVWGGGTLEFLDAEIDFWASSILVENGGTVRAGSPAAPIGTNGGRLTIHLYGDDQGIGGSGVRCKADERCGVPEAIWSSNVTAGGKVPPADARRISEVVPDPPPHTPSDDFFYAYSTLPYDDADPHGYFGYKVLAVSYGGSLELFGHKGASYCSDGRLDCPDELPASTSGSSWARLAATARPGSSTLVLDRAVGWQPGDEIVVTTTDYLPGHSEQREIASVSVTSEGHTQIRLAEPLDYAHNGERYSLDEVPSRIGLTSELADEGAELRAAVGLLTRSIRIVSAGDALGEPFPDGPGEYFGGHTVVRQGFARFQVQGVEFFQLGQGGRIAHYPIHFHHARKTAPETFVKDSSIHDSMTRWVVLHGTHDVTLARNVGYLSIGHGFYLEDGTEIGNRLLSNLGVFARAAVDNAQNPRRVPGILAAPDLRSPAQERVPFRSDYDHPTVFWIMNGWNDFQYNMAAGANACGVCYWLLPGAVSGGSRGMKWESYASMETHLGRAGMTPLKSFVGNSCSSAMTSFNTVGNTAVCHGVGDPGGGFPYLDPIENDLAPRSSDPAAESYYPRVDPGGGRFATRCDGPDCGSVPRCSSSLSPNDPSDENCMVTTLDGFTSSFHWAEFNFAAIWLRPQWYLVTNSVLTDVQGGGLNFVTGGGYSASDRIVGHWALVNKSVFVGNSQPDNPFALDGGPFNQASGLACEGRDDGTGNAILPGNYCLSHDEGVSFPTSNFGMSQRMFSVYDGPAYQSSNAYLDIRRRTIDDCSPVVDGANHSGRCEASEWTDHQGLRRRDSRWLAGHVQGLPKSAGGECYMPNAAIGWKQPNGFYYPPAFHSDNLFFDDVDIRHFLIQPLFEEGTFDTDVSAVEDSYCLFNDTLFSGFTDIDRQTVLNDDDGSLTGYAESISVNVDPFFRVPVEDVECESDDTANVSPYEYVTTVIYPKCATDGTCALEGPNHPPHAGLWDKACSNERCFGVPLYRQQLTESDAGVAPGIKMMGQSIGQRSSLTVNNGVYYVDTTVGEAKQKAEVCSEPGAPCSISVFRPSETYYLFSLFAKPTTRQTYQIYVGEGFDPDSVFLTQADIRTVPVRFTNPRPLPADWHSAYDPATGILEVTMDLSGMEAAFEAGAVAAESCRPSSYCSWDPDRRLCVDARGSDEVCGWAMRDIECPQGGCFGVGFTMPASFATDPATDPRPAATCFPRDDTWDTGFTLADALGGSCPAGPPPAPDFCKLGGGNGGPEAGSLEFSADRLTVLEGDEATLRVARTGGAAGAVSVDVTTAEGGALAGADYTPTTTTLSWSDGDASEKAVSIPTTEDTTVEDDETFFADLSRAAGGAAIGSASRAAVTILDDEGDTTPCIENEATLCLNAAGRFRVTVTWNDGEQGSPAIALPVRRDYGLFSFLSEENAEILVKVLDACGVPGLESYWAFYGATTNLGFTMTITDTETGVVRIYSNTAGEPAQPLLDTGAFPVCHLQD